MSQATRKIPKQPEVNIGTAGHVDHGKCLAFDETVVVDGSPITGRELAARAEGSHLCDFDGGSFFSLEGATVAGLDDGLRVVRTSPFLYVQEYAGAMYTVETSSGRRVSVTPGHPLLSEGRRGLAWTKARELGEGQGIAYVDGPGMEVERVSRISVRRYEGPIFDLTVPPFANFVSGDGGIVCHNTTLTEALTGKWTSAHSEELRRGITIRVGYADAAVYRCTGCSPPACYNTAGECDGCGGEAKLERVISMVDSPGHESLMANMLCGAALMDGALLVIAANEPVPQPQTKEHVQALQMVGVKNIVVAQNKVDLVSYAQALENMERIRAFLDSYGFKDSRIIPISAQKRLNIDALIEAMERVIPTPPRDPDSIPFMSVLRSFDVNMPGTPIADVKGGVVGGTLMKGKLKTGDEVEVKPGIYDSAKGKYTSVVTKVVSLGTSAGLVDEVHPGGLVAIGTSLDPSFTRSDSLVGCLIGPPGTLPEELGQVEMKTSLFGSVVGAPQAIKVEPIKMGEVLRLNVATATTAGSVVQLRGNVVTVKLAKPVCPPPDAKVAISRRVADRWRLIGSGVLTTA
ncbi:MAG: translation initiation factor IF-2 subunit gamma [Nitrososphaerota archaeon]|nr:translation initiation factor IF-2 subunit gamma [Nitrososphaerota archaeon]